jgi:hypothetical protein
MFILKASVAPRATSLLQGYSAIAASGKIDNSALAMRVAARRGDDGTLLIGC